MYDHEDRGYGTTLLEALISLAIQNGFDKNSEVTGMLSNVDARDEKKKDGEICFIIKEGLMSNLTSMPMMEVFALQ